MTINFKQRAIYSVGALIIIILSATMITQQRSRKVEREVQYEKDILSNVKVHQNKDKRSDLGLTASESLLTYSSLDSNTNGRNETLVVAQNMDSKKTHIYILDDSGNILYDSPDMLVGPDKVQPKKYGGDGYYSYHLSFESVGTAGYFIRWNGEEYEVTP